MYLLLGTIRDDIYFLYEGKCSLVHITRENTIHFSGHVYRLPPDHLFCLGEWNGLTLIIRSFSMSL